MDQFRQIQAWKCRMCGRVLSSEAGLARHATSCRFVPPVLEGQLSVYDVAEGSAQTQNSTGGGVL